MRFGEAAPVAIVPSDGAMAFKTGIKCLKPSDPLRDPLGLSRARCRLEPTNNVWRTRDPSLQHSSLRISEETDVMAKLTWMDGDT